MASRKAQSRAPSNGSEDSETNVQVILRCRPPSKEELASRAPQVIKCDEAANAVTLTQNMNGKQLGRTYHFDRIFGPDTTQDRLYDESISSIVEEVLQGFNCTIFAYGQTGTGKTYTMTGDVAAADTHGELPTAAGVIPRAISQIFAHLEDIAGSTEYTVKCCFLELYNEEITDLLALGSEPPKIRILEDRSGVVLQGLEEPHVKGSDEIFALLESGNARRRTAETLLNKQSSRSHSVFIVTVSVREVLAEGEEVIRVGKLYLVDLAGSENVSRSGAVDQRAKEAGNINKSLLTLGRVITALVEGQGHVPYRDSKLTRLLRDSLGGRTKTCIIATIAPTVHCQEETLSTLDYAHRAKNIKNKPEINQKISKTTHLKEMSGEIARLKAELVAQRERNGVYLPAAQYDEECAERQRLAIRVEELEEELVRAAERVEMVRGELTAAQETIAERDYMLRAHHRAEEALAQHAFVLTDDLTQASQDVSKLVSRVATKNTLEDANVSVVQELKHDAMQRLGELDASLQATAQAHAGRLAEASILLEKTSQRKADARKNLAERIAALEGQVDGIKTAMAAAVTAVSDTAATALEKVGESQAQYFENAQKSAEDASTAVGEAYAALLANEKDEKEILEATLAGQTAAAQAIRGATDTLVSAVRQHLTAAQNDASLTSAAVQESFQSQAKASQTLASSFATSLRQEQVALLQQLQSLIGGFVEHAEAQVALGVKDITSQAAADEARLGAAVGKLAEHADASLTALESGAKAVEVAQTAAEGALQDGGARMTAIVEACSADAATLEATASGHAKEALAALVKHSKAVATAVKKDTKLLEATATKQQKACHAAGKAAAVELSTFHTDMTQELEADGIAVASVRGQVCSAAQDISVFAEQQHSGLHAMGTAIRQAVDERYAVDADRDDVPVLRQRPVPGRAEVEKLRAPSPQKLAAQFREAGSDSVDCSPMEESAHVRSSNTKSAVDMTTISPSEPDENGAPQLVAVLSPSAVGQKRARSDDGGGEHASPSKLRAAFQRGELRRGQRHAPVAP